jgi:hypothetical protein
MQLERYAQLSILAALATIALKGVAWWVTGSVGLLSDALESFVNLAAAVMAFSMLRPCGYAAGQGLPLWLLQGGVPRRGRRGRADRARRRGHRLGRRAAAARPGAAGYAGPRTRLSVAASIINFAVARVLIRAGTRTTASRWRRTASTS